MAKTVNETDGAAGQDEAPLTRDEARYIVTHDMVGPYHRGQEITVTHLKMGLDREIDIDRLLRVGAIAPVGSQTAAAVRSELGADAVTREDQPVTAEVPLPPLDATHPASPQNTGGAGQ